ncbi:Eukaryotic translation initiation factor 3 subunit J [Linum perenne]
MRNQSPPNSPVMVTEKDTAAELTVSDNNRSSNNDDKGKDLDSFIPKSEADFSEYAELISEKLLRPYEKSFHYIGLVKAVVRLLTSGLTAAQVKEIASSVTAVANEKLKAEKEAGKKKGGSGGKKKQQIRVDKSKDAFVDNNADRDKNVVHSSYDMSDEEDYKFI